MAKQYINKYTWTMQIGNDELIITAMVVGEWKDRM